MRVIIYLVLFMVSLSNFGLRAEALTPDKVPEPLKPWIDWVLKAYPQRDCTFSFAQFDNKQCSWPIDLTLDLHAKGGHFQGHWLVDHESWLQLPGGDGFWPQQVRVNNAPAVVLDKDHPQVKLPPGHYTISGDFVWDFIPEELHLDQETGLIKLMMNDVQVNSPTLKNGVLWLKDSDRGGKNPEKVEDRLELQVFRKIIDSVPLQVLTHINLDVAGSPRETKLTQALLHDAIAMRLDSPLQARLEADGQLLVQLRPGHWELELLARFPGPVDRLVFQESAFWPKDELWVFEARPHLRMVDIIDLTAIDASQTQLPEAWRNLPTYRINTGEAMSFKLQRRGSPELEPNQLNINREFWLDFDGRGYTIKDQIQGQMRSDWRLNVLPDMHLGKVTMQGENQLITRTPEGKVGIEVRQGNLNVLAESRYTGNIRKFAINGWQQNFQSVSTEINLPPGWSLLATKGTDNVPDSWMTRWTLLDLFMVLMAALTFAKLYANTQKWSYAWGALALITLALCWHEREAPHWIWLNILAITALLRVLPQNRFFALLNSYRKLCGVVLVLIVVPFVIDQVRIGIYPQLAMPWQNVLMSDESGGYPASAQFDFYTVSPKSKNDAEKIAEVAGAPNAAPVEEGVVERSLAKSELKERTYPFKEIDPFANVQTGPGLPQWQWHKVHLQWNGSVDSQQRVKLWYLSPTTTMLLNFLRVILVTVLALRLFGQYAGGFKMRFVNCSWVLGIVSLPILFSLSQPSHAAFPDQAMLTELTNRLLEAPDCLPQCAEIEDLQVQITPDLLQITCRINAQENVAIPVPGQQDQWLPEQVLLDAAMPGLLRSEEGQLWVQVKKGQHHLLLKGKPPALDKFTLALPLLPHHVGLSQTGWDIAGVHEHGQVDEQLQFTRVSDVHASAGPALTASTLPALFSIERTLHFGLDWRISNRVVRITPADSAVFLKVPLLAGESVLSPGLRVENNQLQLSIAAQQTETAWDSVLAKNASIQLVAPNNTQWTETWRADVSPIWHLQTEGLAPVHPGQQDTFQPEWQPWPGEQVTMHLTRPEGVEGQTLTLQNSQLTVTPGKRIAEVKLTLQLTSSKGGQHSLTLPDAAELQSVSIDGVLQPIRLQANKLIMPVKPGKQSWLIVWRQVQTQGTLFKSPVVHVGLTGVNSRINVDLAQDRWVLLVLGPQLGPAVLFWGVLLVIGLIAAGLARTQLTPLRGWQWFLLLIGLSQIPLEAALLVVAWFLLLAWRSNVIQTSRGYFNSLQVFLACLTLVTGACLFLAVEKGLLGTPEMQILGNQSTAYQLHWYQDRSEAVLPIATVISVPLLVYRCLMLLWSLWLAVALIGWLKWGWRCFSSAKLWMSKAPKKGETETQQLPSS